jgi:hypothetical protein
MFELPPPSGTPEEHAAHIERSCWDRKRSRLPIDVREGPEGFSATRDGRAGRGATRDAAIERLEAIERRWVVDPTGFLDDLLEGKIDPNTLKPI